MFNNSFGLDLSKSRTVYPSSEFSFTAYTCFQELEFSRKQRYDLPEVKISQDISFKVRCNFASVNGILQDIDFNIHHNFASVVGSGC